MERRKRGPKGRDRRRTSGDFRTTPRPSPANILILTVAGAILATAAASVLSSGISDSTPHGRLLGALGRIADAQERSWEAQGRFAGDLPALSITPGSGIAVRVTRADALGWEAVASDPEVGLTCRQGGRISLGRPQRQEPVCYTEGP